MSDILSVGDRVRIGGGYDTPPRWLHNRDSYEGVVLGFIPKEKNSESSYCVVKLEESISFEHIIGNIIVMSLRYADAIWDSKETVHIVLCRHQPQDPSFWKNERDCIWAESHAYYERLTRPSRT